MKPANSQQARRKVERPWFRVFIRRQDESEGLTCIEGKSVGRNYASEIWERRVPLVKGFCWTKEGVPVNNDCHWQCHERHEHCKERHPT
jgi:hypothetical protein